MLLRSPIDRLIAAHPGAGAVVDLLVAIWHGKCMSLIGEFSAATGPMKSHRVGGVAGFQVGEGTHMALTKPGSSTDVADIQRQMAQIRHDMHREVQGAVRGAQTLTEWRSLVRSYPWLSLSVAALAGYFVVPKRRREPPAIVAVTAPGPEFLANASGGKKEERAGLSGWTVIGTAFSLLTPIVVRAAQNYALTYFEQWLADHPLAPPGANRQDGPRSAAGQPPRSTMPSDRLRDFG